MTTTHKEKKKKTALHSVISGPHLCDQRPVLLTHLIVEVFSSVVGIANKHLSVEHGGVTEVSPVPTAQQAPGQLALVHHGRHHVGRFLQSLLPELEALELGHRR